MRAPRTPRSTDAAAKLLERYAELDAKVALSNQVRDAAIAEANRLADAENAPLIEERDKIAAAIEAWWVEKGAGLCEGERKSIELAGCMIGTRKDKPSLAMGATAKEMVEALGKARWGKTLLRVTTSLDKRAITKALEGRHGQKLEDMGFSIDEGGDRFFVERVAQDGVRE